MPLSQLDPMPALVVVDMQKGIVALPTAHPAPSVAAQVGKLASAFRAKNLPVVLVNVSGLAPGRTENSHSFDPPPDWTELIPELDRQPQDHLVTKQRWGAFHQTSLDSFLREKGATQVVVAGIATSLGV